MRRSVRSIILPELLAPYRSTSIANTLRGVPFGSDWNGSLWSLFYEFLCYLMLALFAFSESSATAGWSQFWLLLPGGPS